MELQIPKLRNRSFFPSLLERRRRIDQVLFAVISDAHAGLVAAIAQVFLGAAWQRCRVHFVRDVLSRIEPGSGEMVAATIRTIFAPT